MVRLITINPMAEFPLDAQLMKLIFLLNLNKKILSSMHKHTHAWGSVCTHMHAQADMHTKYIIGG